MAFEFLDKVGSRVVGGQTGVDVSGQGKFVAQAYEPPVSPRSTSIVYTEDDLLPVTDVADRYRAPDDPVAFEVSFVTSPDSSVELLSRSLLQVNYTEDTARERLQGLGEATPEMLTEFDALVSKLTPYQEKLSRAKKSKSRRRIQKQIAVIVDSFVKEQLSGSRRIILNPNDPLQAKLAERYYKLSGVKGLYVSQVPKELHGVDAPGIGAKADSEQETWLRSVMADALHKIGSTPALEFSVPPREVSLSLSKILFDGNMTKNGYQVEHWGEALDVLSCSGRTGAFFTVSRTTGFGGLSSYLRRGSRSFQELMAIISIYRSNGLIYHTLGDNAGQVNVPAALVRIQFGRHTFVGRFDEFSVNETDEQPYSLEYSFKFTSFQTFLHGSGSSGTFAVPGKKFVVKATEDADGGVEVGTP